MANQMFEEALSVTEQEGNPQSISLPAPVTEQESNTQLVIPPYVNGYAQPASLTEEGQHEEPESLTDIVQAALAGVALVVLSPLLVLIAILVKVTSSGPILYRGARVGKGGRVFTIYKFRTLLEGAERKIGARLLSEKDTFYTPVGRFLKQTKIDEVPQLWNVLKGDMRLVGPRPVRPIFLERFVNDISGYRQRFCVKPGMTGLAQVRGGYLTPPRHKLRYELAYISNRSVWMDMQIVLLTFVKICHRWFSFGFLLVSLLLFASFIPAALFSSFYVSVWGVRFNAVHGVIVVYGVWLLGRQLPRHRLSLYRSPLYLPMGVFFLSGLIASMFSFDPAQAVRGSAYHAVTGFFIALGIINSNLTRRFVRRSMNIVAVTAIVLSGLGLLNLLLGDYLLSTHSSAATQPSLFYSDQGIAATLGSPAVLAAYLTLAVPALLCRLGQARDRERDFWVVGATLTFIGIILTKTPVGLCALVLTLALYMSKYARPHNMVFCLSALSPFLVLSLLNIDFSMQKVGAVLAKGWHELLSQPLHYVLFGYGARTIRESWDIVQGISTLPLLSQSTYLALVVENGLLGASAMLWIVVVTLLMIFRAHQRASDIEIRRILWAAFCSIIGFLVSLFGCNAFSNLTLQVLFWGAIGLGLGTSMHLSGQRKEFLVNLKLGH